MPAVLVALNPALLFLFYSSVIYPSCFYFPNTTLHCIYPCSTQDLVKSSLVQFGKMFRGIRLRVFIYNACKEILENLISIGDDDIIILPCLHYFNFVCIGILRVAFLLHVLIQPGKSDNCAILCARLKH